MFRDLGRLPEAVEQFGRALRLQPGLAEVHNNLGNAYRALGRLPEAVVQFEQALRLRPGYAEARNNLGNTLRALGRLPEALEQYELALRGQPDNPVPRWNRSLVWLVQGDFAQGWREHECRPRHPLNADDRFRQPRWDGGPLNGRTILLTAEQGLGDTLQFIRYAPLVQQQGGTVVFECQPPLVPLLIGMAGIDLLLPRQSPLPPFDVHAPLLSLPWLFGTTLETVPTAVPYLHADASRVEHWRRELSGYPGFRVGIAWQGIPRTIGDRWRSIPLDFFEPLARVPGVHLFSLQKGPGSEQLARLGGRFAVTDLGGPHDEASGPFTERAAVLRSLDLFITSDSVLAHLAGALAVPTWVALPGVADWRWLLDRADSPWYPTLRLFRQTEAGDWRGVFARIAAALAELLATSR